MPLANSSATELLYPLHAGPYVPGTHEPRTQRVRHTHGCAKWKFAGNTLHRVSVAAAIGRVAIRSVKHPAIVKADVSDCKGLRHHFKSSGLDVTEMTAAHQCTLDTSLNLLRFATTEQLTKVRNVQTH